jgi:hypothetical protein
LIFDSEFGMFLEEAESEVFILGTKILATIVILAFMFWRSLVAEQHAEEFASTHFFFALFIYCAYRLISTYFKGKAE